MKTPRKLTSILLFAGAILSLAVSPAIAGESAGGFVKDRQAKVTTLLRQPEGPAREHRIAEVLDAMLDYTDLARRSLAQHWDGLSEKQRTQFTAVLKELVQRSYERNLKSILNYSVELAGEEPIAEGVLVHTRATGKSKSDEEPITIDYNLIKAGDAWRVRDIVTEGASLVNNYKNQFNRVIRKEGYDALYAKMAKKAAAPADTDVD